MCRIGIEETPGHPPDAAQVKSDSTSLSRGSPALGVGTRDPVLSHPARNEPAEDPRRREQPILFQRETCRPRVGPRRCLVSLGVVVVGVVSPNRDLGLMVRKEKYLQVGRKLKCHLDAATLFPTKPLSGAWGAVDGFVDRNMDTFSRLLTKLVYPE